MYTTNDADISCSITPDSMCTGDLDPDDGKCSCDCGQGFTTNKSADSKYQYCTHKISSCIMIMVLVVLRCQYSAYTAYIQ